MSNRNILKIAIDVPLSREFDYLAPARGPAPTVGCRVWVPFGNQRKVGLVLDTCDETAIDAGKIRAAFEVLDDDPLLAAAELWLIRFTSDYYHHPVGEVVAAALPSLLRQGRDLHPRVELVAVTDMGESTDVETLARRAPRQAELLELLIDDGGNGVDLSLIHISEPTRPPLLSRMPSSA